MPIMSASVSSLMHGSTFSGRSVLAEVGEEEESPCQAFSLELNMIDEVGLDAGSSGRGGATGAPPRGRTFLERARDDGRLAELA